MQETTSENNNSFEESHDTASIKRFVSLYGFYAFYHPHTWVNEVDTAGNFIFFEPNGGAGVVRIITEQRVVIDDSEADKYMDQVLVVQKDYDAADLLFGKRRFIRFVQLHDVEGKSFNVTCYITAEKDKVLMITFTVQDGMKTLSTATNELKQLEQMLSTLAFMHSDEHHHDQ